MEPSEVFNDTNKVLTKLFFSIKLNIASKRIEENEIKDLIRSLRTSHKKSFGSAQYLYSPEIDEMIIYAKGRKRQINLTPFSIDYLELNRFNFDEFNKICKRLYDFYVETKEVDPIDIKLVGKVFSYDFNLNQKAMDLLKNNLNLFKDKDLNRFSINVTMIENDKNIHITLTGIKPSEEDDSDEVENTFYTTFDINNNDQTSGLKNESFMEVINFADDFAKNKLLSTLNTYFS
jgi:hypothetical protein